MNQIEEIESSCNNLTKVCPSSSQTNFNHSLHQEVLKPKNSTKLEKDDVQSKELIQIYSEIAEGSNVYAMKTSFEKSWELCVVQNIYKDQIRVKFPTRSALLSKKKVACYNLSQETFKVGSRVIATYDLPVDNETMENFHAGIIGECPCGYNKERYLVLFDNGYARYRFHQYIRAILETSKCISDDISQNNQDFIINYLKYYPKQELQEFFALDNILIKLKKYWKKAQVIDVDASVVKITFPNQLNKYEYLYRGSPNLLKSNARSKQTNVNKQYSLIDEDKKMFRPASLPVSKMKTHSNNVHVCNHSCIEWTLYDLKKTQVINTLAIPLNFGFKRGMNDNKKISYLTPCGLFIKDEKEMYDYLIATKSEMTIDQFDFTCYLNPLSEFKVSKCIKFLPDISNGLEFKSISCVNSVNNELPLPLVYITKCQPSPDVNINTDSNFLCGCDCTDNCQNKFMCACWQRTISGQEFLPEDSNIGYKYRRLFENVVSGIYECNALCKCRNSCLNRVIQHQLSQKLQLFLSENKGWGVRCLNDIPIGSHICNYVGNLLSDTVANEQGLHFGDEYFLELDYIEILNRYKLEAKNHSKSVRKYFGPQEKVYVLDAKSHGNIGRYFNHSCNPNLFVQNVFVNSHDVRFPWISFFAKCFIPAGTELVWDYGYTIGSVPGRVIVCKCNSVNCRGRLL